MDDNTIMTDFTNIKEEELPEIISKQFIKLEELENNVKKAVESAIKAKEKAQNANIPAGFGKKKKAIETLQGAVEGSADALVVMSEVQKISFEYQSKLAEITKYLFGLGVSNIARNRSVVKELKLRLKNASEDDISELARQELKNVILQLKSQEDFMEKQEFLTKKVKEQAEKMNESIASIDEKFEKQTEELNDSIQKNSGDFENKLLNISTELKGDISELKEEVKKQTEEISSGIADLENRIKLLEVITGKKLWKISIGGIAIVSLLLSIFQLIGVM